MSDFIHLRLHTEFSLEDGMITLKKLISYCKEQHMPAIAVTDMSNFFGAVRFYEKALSAGLKPIFGMDIWLENPNPQDAPTKLSLLVQNQVGYSNLVELISRAFRENFSDDKPLIKRQWLSEQSAGLIALSAAQDGDIGQALLDNNPALAQECAQWYQSVFPSRLYLEIQRQDKDKQDALVHLTAELASQLQLPLVATNDARFVAKSDFDAHEARVCIHQSRVLHDSRRPKNYTPEQYLKTAHEMRLLFKDYPEAIANTVEIAKRCNFQFSLYENFLPQFPVPEGMTTGEFLVEESRKGLEKRFNTILAKLPEAEHEQVRKEYNDRLDFELTIINDMEFPGYFLIVADFIQWAKQQDIPVGPGRGSGAGSLVAYVLEITNLDPIEYELLFERFLNPERVSMPDFDIDFCMDRRDEVIDYVKDLYGKDAVSQIITFGTLAARAVIKDVTRVQGKPYGLGDRLSKLIPFKPGMTLAKAVDAEPEIEAFLNSEDDGDMAKEVWDMAVKLEGLSRNTGKHAAGIVISPGKLTDFSPLYCDEDPNNLVTHYDKDDVEKIGLVKFDFLGLKNLTLIDWAVRDINIKRARLNEPPIDIDLIPLDDLATFDLLCKGQTTAIFQLESSGMKALIKRLQPSVFEDIVALVALYRPGPLDSGMVDDFVDRKHGRQAVDYPHPSLEPILKETYGTLVYQEQIMQTAQTLASYSLGEADMLRRAMGKKKADIMAENKQTFCERAESNGVDAKLASGIFENIEAFASYCFNKSHSAAYALVSYQTAWLKTHYPAQFMAAVLSSDMENTEKVVLFLNECFDIGIEVALPNVNEGQYNFTVDENDRIIYGLGSIKGVGEGPIESLIAAREQKPFTDFFDFCMRVDKLNKRAVEALIKSGALDIFIESKEQRASMMESIALALKAAQQEKQNQTLGMVDLFGELEAEENQSHLALIQTESWPKKLHYAYELETLGLYLTGHPFEDDQKIVAPFVSRPLSELELRNNEKKAHITIAGLISEKRVITTKKGSRFGVLQLEDGKGKQEITIGEQQIESVFEKFELADSVVVRGALTYDSYRESHRFSTDQLFSIAEAKVVFLRQLELELSSELEAKQAFSLIQPHLTQDETEVQSELLLKIRVKNSVEGLISMTYKQKFIPNVILIENLIETLAVDSVKLQY